MTEVREVRGRNYTRIYDLIYLTAYAVMLVFYFTASTQIRSTALWKSAYKPVFYLVMLILIADLILFSSLSRWALIFSALTLAMGLPIMLATTRKIELMAMLLLIIGGISVSERKLLRMYIVITAVLVPAVILSSVIGWLPWDSTARFGEGRIRYYLGFTYTNYTGHFLLSAVLAWAAFKDRCFTVLETIVILFLNALVYHYTYGRAACWCVILFLALVWLIRLFPGLSRLKLAKLATIWIMPVLTAIIFFLAVHADRFTRLDNLMNNRISQPYKALQKYGIHLFGTEVEWVTGRAGIDRAASQEYLFVDDSYLNILIHYGPVMLVFVLAGFMLLGRKYYREARYEACLALIVLALHTFSDEILFEIRFDPFLVLIGGAYVRNSRIIRRSSIMKKADAGRYPEREVSTRALFTGILEHWRLILLAGLLAGAVLGGMKVRSVMKSREDAESLKAAQERYETELQAYNEAKAAYTTEMNKIDEAIKLRQQYLKDSVLLNYSDYTYMIGSAMVYVRMDEEETADGAVLVSREKQLSNYYNALIRFGIDWSDLAEEMGTEPLYVRELIIVNKGNDPEGGLQVIARTENEEIARKILEKIRETLNGAQGTAAVLFGAHELLFENENYQRTIYSDDISLLYNRTNDLNNLNLSRKQLKALADGLSRPSAPAAMTKKTIIKSGLKSAVIGFAGGVLLVVLLLGIRLVAGGYVLSADELNRQYGLMPLAVLRQLRKGRSKKGIDRLVEMLDPAWRTAGSREIQLAVCGECVAEKAEGGRIAVIGDITDEEGRSVCKAIADSAGDADVICLPEASGSPESLRTLSGCTGAVLMVRRGRSVYERIEKELEAVGYRDIPVIGSVVL